jgi:hypothetical protein
MTLEDNLAALESSVSNLKAERNIGPLQNDIFEAIDDLCHLGQRVIAKDTRVDYPRRAQSDLAVLQNLRDIVSARAEEDNLGDFWVEDLLYLHGDERYQSVPQAIHLNSEAAVDEWFLFISAALRGYGDDLLRDIPGALDRLAQAQSERDAEYVTKMNTEHGFERNASTREARIPRSSPAPNQLPAISMTIPMPPVQPGCAPADC